MKKKITRRDFLGTAAGASLAATGCGKRCVIKAHPPPVSIPNDSVSPAPLCQVAFSVSDLDRTHQWYQEVLGFVDSGGTSFFFGPIASAIQGLAKVNSDAKWLVDQQDFRQLEMFHYDSPEPRYFARAPNDIGYAMLGVHVADFDKTVKRLAAAGTEPLTSPLGTHGARRVCVRDPEGALLELMEDDPRESGAPERPRPDVPVAIRSITISVPDLERSKRFFVDTLKLSAVEPQNLLHRPEHEKLWGLDGAESKSLLLWASDFLIELKEYTKPRGKPRPEDYRISDLGLLNIAFGFREREHFDGFYERVTRSGYESNSNPFYFPGWAVVYVNDDQCFSVELLRVHRRADGFMGFEPE